MEVFGGSIAASYACRTLLAKILQFVGCVASAPLALDSPLDGTPPQDGTRELRPWKLR